MAEGRHAHTALSLTQSRVPEGMRKKGCPMPAGVVFPRSHKTCQLMKVCKGSTTPQQQEWLSTCNPSQGSQPAGTCSRSGPLPHTPTQHQPQLKYGGRSPGQSHGELPKQDLNRLYCYNGVPTEQGLINQFMWSHDVAMEKSRGHSN